MTGNLLEPPSMTLEAAGAERLQRTGSRLISERDRIFDAFAAETGSGIDRSSSKGRNARLPVSRTLTQVSKLQRVSPYGCPHPSRERDSSIVRYPHRGEGKSNSTSGTHVIEPSPLRAK